MNEIKTLNELVSRLEETIKECNNEFAIAEKFDKYVVIYLPTKENEIFYGMTSNESNQISEGIKNVLPTPNRNIIKCMRLTDALEAYHSLPRIINGEGKLFIGEVVTYKEYLYKYLQDLKKSYASIKSLLK